MLDFFSGFGFMADASGIAGIFIDKLRTSESDWKEFLTHIRKTVKSVLKIYCEFVEQSHDHNDIIVPSEYESLLYNSIVLALEKNEPFSLEHILPTESDFPIEEKKRIYGLLYTKLNYSFEAVMRDGISDIKHQLKDLKKYASDVFPVVEKNLDISNDILNLITEVHTTIHSKNSSEKQKDSHTGKVVKSPQRKRSVSIWLPDAEQAKGDATRFNTFTRTDLISEFLESDSNYWGISSVKGIGKTFVLQIKRISLTKEAVCFPHYEKPSSANNWATESIQITNIDVKFWHNFNNGVLLWRYLIICYTLCNLVNYHKYEQSRYEIDELKDKLLEYKAKNKISEQTYDFCTESEFTKLNAIFAHIQLSIKNDSNWEEKFHDEYDQLGLLHKKIESCLKKIKRKYIAIFIDKIDQSIKLANAEMPADCAECQKCKKISSCYKDGDFGEHCFSSNKVCATQCCFGCEVYTAEHYSNNNLRIYINQGKSSPWEHINKWQYLQLTLIYAAYQVKESFAGLIKIYYTVRQEAFFCESTLLGEHRKKINMLTMKLHYSKDEQEQIFLDCIRNQDDSLLYNPELKNIVGREEEALLGINGFCHPYVKNATESVFECIYRHSFDRSRDIQLYGDMLTHNIKEIRSITDWQERTEKIKRLIEDFAKQLAYEIKKGDNSVLLSYYHEKLQFMPNYWTINDNIENLLMKIDRNILFKDDVMRMCAEINGKQNCTYNDCLLKDCKYHPFSFLYKLGLVGKIVVNNNTTNDERQDFIEAEDVTYIKEKDCIYSDNNMIYLVHPALTKSIEKNIVHKNIKHFNGFIIGKDIMVPQEKLIELLRDKEILPADEFEKKYFGKS